MSNNNEIIHHPAKCPICGHANHCGMLGNDPKSGEHCWCASAQFPPTLLNQVPKQAKYRGCICQRCSHKHQA